MKPQNRIRNNRSTKPACGQASIPEPGIDGTGYSGNEPICLTVFDHDSDADLAGCDITANEWARIKALSTKSGVPVGTMLKRAVQNLAADSGDDARAALLRFEDVKSEAVAVIKLMDEQLSKTAGQQQQFSNEEAIQTGLSMWADRVTDNLQETFDTVWKTFHPNHRNA